MAILTDAPSNAVVLDLGAARAARQEARAAAGEANPVIKLAAGFVEVRPEIDVLCAEEFTAGRIKEGLARMLADPADVDVLVDGGISKEDVSAIMEFISGVSLGE